MFELSRQLPRFAMYAPVEVHEFGHGSVSFTLQERVQRVRAKFSFLAQSITKVAMWMNQNFLLPDELEIPQGGNLNRSFLSLRTSLPLGIQMTAGGATTIRTSDMNVAGDMIAALATYLNVDHLDVPTFPATNLTHTLGPSRLPG